MAEETHGENKRRRGEGGTIITTEGHKSLFFLSFWKGAWPTVDAETNSQALLREGEGESGLPTVTIRPPWKA